MIFRMHMKLHRSIYLNQLLNQILIIFTIEKKFFWDLLLLKFDFTNNLANYFSTKCSCADCIILNLCYHMLSHKVLKVYGLIE